MINIDIIEKKKALKMDKQELVELLEDKRVVYFATVNQDGHPRVRPFSVAKVKDGKIYFFTGSFKEVYKELKANPNVEFSIQGGGASIRVRGIVKFEDSREIVNYLLDKNPGLRELYKDRMETLKVLYIEGGEVHIFEMKDPFSRTIHFAFNLK